MVNSIFTATLLRSIANQIATVHNPKKNKIDNTLHSVLYLRTSAMAVFDKHNIERIIPAMDKEKNAVKVSHVPRILLISFLLSFSLSPFAIVLV